MANILVLGATSAIAQQMARLLAARGDRLFLVGRNPDKLAALVASLGANVVGSAAADLDSLPQNGACIEAAIQALGTLDMAILAHGYLGDQLASEAQWAEAEAILTTNLLSPISLLIPLANYFERQGRGKIGVLSSVAGERGRPRNYTYGAAKGALTLYLQGLRSRLYPAIQVTSIKLGPVDTPMTVDHAKNRLFATAPQVAKEIIDALDSGAAEPYVPWFWRPIMGAVKTLPEPLFQKIKAFSGR